MLKLFTVTIFKTYILYINLYACCDSIMRL